VGVACLRALSGEMIAVLATYGCHPVVLGAGNRLVSADYPGPLLSALEEALGGCGFFLTGACGNTDPVRRGSFEEVTWLGEQLAARVLKVAGPVEMSPVHNLAVGHESLSLPLQEIAGREVLEAEITQRRQRLGVVDPLSTEARVEQAMLAWAESTLARVATGDLPAAVNAEVQVLRFGALAIVGVSGELFSDLGREIRVGIPDLGTDVFVTGCANGDVGYIPDAAAYATGGYEVSDAFKYYGYPAALAPEAGAALVAAARRLLLFTRP
jgi:neutral ceramidase